MAPQDRSYLTELVAERTGLDRAAAEARVNETEAAARQALDTARKATAHSFYWLFAAVFFRFSGYSGMDVGRDNAIYVGAQPTGRT